MRTDLASLIRGALALVPALALCTPANAQGFGVLEWTLDGASGGSGSLTDDVMHLESSSAGICETPFASSTGYDIKVYSTVAPYDAVVSVHLAFDNLDTCPSFWHFEQPIYVLNGVQSIIICDNACFDFEADFSFEVEAGDEFALGVRSVDCACEPGVADYVAPSGEYLSGFWIGSGTDLPRFSIGGTSELTPGWLPQLGSGSAEAPFGLTQSWGCESSETAVGIMIAHDGAPIGVAFPGVFALLCAPSAQVAASAVLPDDLVLRHGGYLNTPPGSVQGVAAIWTFLSAWTGRDPVLESCGPGEALTGVRGREGSLVYRIDSIRCREVATEAPDQLYLNWGLFGGVPFDVQCPAGTHIHGGLVNHVEPSIAGLRFRCVGY